MTKKLSVLITNLVIWILIPIGLILYLGSDLYEELKTEGGILIAAEFHNFSNVKPSTELHANDIVTDEFTAGFNNLGLVTIRFYNFNRISDDWLIFRIKQVGASQWYYENKYKVDQFLPDELFPFGFPLITSSRGNNYVFQIESTQGQDGNAIAISSVRPQYSARYKIQLSQLLTNKSELIKFLYLKVTEILSTPRLLKLIIIRVLIIACYLGFLIFVKLRHNNFFNTVVSSSISLGNLVSRNPLLGVISVLLTSLDILVIKSQNSLRLTALLILVVLSIIFYKVKTNFILAVSGCAMLLYLLFFVLNLDYVANDFFVWSYLLLVIGLIKILVSWRALRVNH